MADFDIALLVLRAYRNRYADLLPAVAVALSVLETIAPGDVIYVYADEGIEQSDRRRKKGPFSA